MPCQIAPCPYSQSDCSLSLTACPVISYCLLPCMPPAPLLHYLRPGMLAFSALNIVIAVASNAGAPPAGLPAHGHVGRRHSLVAAGCGPAWPKAGTTAAITSTFTGA